MPKSKFNMEAMVAALGGKSYDLSKSQDREALLASTPVTLFPSPKSAQGLIDLGLPVKVLKFPDADWSVERKEYTGKTGKKYTRSIFRLDRIIVTFNQHLDDNWAHRQSLVTWPHLEIIKEAMKKEAASDNEETFDQD